MISVEFLRIVAVFIRLDKLKLEYGVVYPLGKYNADK